MIFPVIVGRLSIIDDSPRSEFSPRQRHTLKEFAVSRSHRGPRSKMSLVRGLTLDR